MGECCKVNALFEQQSVSLHAKHLNFEKSLTLTKIQGMTWARVADKELFILISRPAFSTAISGSAFKLLEYWKIFDFDQNWKDVLGKGGLQVVVHFKQQTCNFNSNQWVCMFVSRGTCLSMCLSKKTKQTKKFPSSFVLGLDQILYRLCRLFFPDKWKQNWPQFWQKLKNQVKAAETHALSLFLTKNELIVQLKISCQKIAIWK